MITTQQRMLLGQFEEDIHGSAGRAQAELKKLQTLTKIAPHRLAQLGSEGIKLAELGTRLAYWAGVLSGQEQKDG